MKEERKGELFIFIETFFSGLFPVLITLSLFAIPPVTALAWNTLLGALVFGVVLVYRKKRNELLNPILWWYAAVIALFIAIGYHVLYFLGVTQTSAGNASIIALFEVFNAYVLFNFIRKESFPLEHIIGSVCMLAGALIVLLKNFSSFESGDFLIFAATFIPPLGNLYQKKARAIASPETVLFLRSIIAVPPLFFMAYLFGERVSPQTLYVALPFLVLNGLVLFGLSKWLWLEAIHRISVTKALVLKSLAPLLTLLFGWLLLHQSATAWQFASLIPFFFGVVLLTGQFRIRKIRNPLDADFEPHV